MSAKFNASDPPSLKVTRTGPKHNAKAYSSAMRPSSPVQASVVSVCRHPGEALLEENTVDKKSHPVKVNVSGCVFNQNMDAKLLKKIFAEGHLLESAEDRGLMESRGRQWCFLQDNDPERKSLEVQTWLHNKGISCIGFPPYPPDLNPIEHP
jgi:hypothetical protein